MQRLEEIVLAKAKDQQRRTHQQHLDAQVRSTAGMFAQAPRERLRWLSSHAGGNSSGDKRFVVAEVHDRRGGGVLDRHAIAVVGCMMDRIWP